MKKRQETKKGFWANLFSPKPKKSSDDNIKTEDNINLRSSCVCVSGTVVTSNSKPVEMYDKEVLVLGPGCAKCRETYNIVERVITESHVSAKLSKIEDIVEMINYNIMTTPAVVVDGAVKIKGHVPTVEEVKKALEI